MDQFNQAVQLNSQGINALLDGNDVDAANSFTECVKMFKTILSTLGVCTPTEFEVGPTQSPVQPQRNAIGDISVELPNVIVNGHQLQDSIFFNQAVTIPKSSFQSPPPVEQYIHVCAAAAVFNLAITHHRKGKKMGLAACTAKAEKLYSTVLKLLCDDCYNNNTVIGVLVKLASINNLLDIRFESGNHDLAKDGFSLVFNMLRSCDPSYDLVVDTPSFRETEVKSLLKNILLLRPPRVAPAA